MQEKRPTLPLFWRDQRGMNLLETSVALILVALIVVPLTVALSFIIANSDRLADRATLLLVAKTQLEDSLSQPYQTSDTAAYPIVESVPDGYSVSLTITKPVTYVYAAPSSTETPEVLQKIAVTVTGLHGSFTLEGFKARR